MKLIGKRIALYARVSTEEQAKHGESIDDQIFALKQWAEDHQCIVVDQFVDAGFSAHKSYRSRPALRALLDQLNQIDIVVFTKLDRWTRRNGDYYKIQEKLDGHKVSWIAILEDYETETSDGRFKVGIMLSVNQHEAERTSDRIKFTFAQKRQRGEICSGNMPKGYKLVGKKPIKDEATQAGIDAFWRSYCAGVGLMSCIDAAATHGVKIPLSTASFMLRNANSYAGIIQGVKTDPYISEAERDMVLSTRKRKPRKTDAIYLFSGIVFCGDCGSRMGSHRQSSTIKKSYYYNCSKHYARGACSCAVNMTESKIESYLLEHITGAMDTLALDSEMTKSNEEVVDIQKIQARIKSLQTRWDRGWQAYLAGVVSLEEFQAERTVIDKEISFLNDKRKIRHKKTPEEIRSILPENWDTTYKDLSDIGKREFWFKILEKIIINPDRSIHFVLRI